MVAGSFGIEFRLQSQTVAFQTRKSIPGLNKDLGEFVLKPNDKVLGGRIVVGITLSHCVK